MLLQMSTRMMSAPSAASLTACERPCPRAPPVTKATFPSSLDISFLHSRWSIFKGQLHCREFNVDRRTGVRLHDGQLVRRNAIGREQCQFDVDTSTASRQDGEPCHLVRAYPGFGVTHACPEHRFHVQDNEGGKHGLADVHRRKALTPLEMHFTQITGAGHRGP